METHSTFQVGLLVVLLLVASAVAIAVKWVRVPYSIALVIVGLAMGLWHIIPAVEMTPELILLVFLPALLFEASWNLHLDELKRNWLSISVLATAGVLISTLIVGSIMHYWGGMAIGCAFVFGAMISATDPISVLALFRTLGIDKRLTMILEGESIFNDGTAAVFFKVILAITMTQQVFDPGSSLLRVVFEICGGVAIGAALGFAASTVTRLFDDHLLEITLTATLAYGSFLLAEQCHVSPVLSVVAAGIVMGNYGATEGMSTNTRFAVNSFWEYAAFLVNSLVFLLIGMQVKFNLLVEYGGMIGIAIVAILVARIPVAYLITQFCASKNLPIPLNWRHLLFWGALRGSLCMALALSLPINFPNREQFIITAFGVVLFTLIVQGLTIEPLVKLLKIHPEPVIVEDEALATISS
ncbi:MAG: Na+/H+ antiporter [Leptolyngbya sp.]|nr:Na+/H+ antiporter [Candidatus Melainabacteria bacterium]